MKRLSVLVALTALSVAQPALAQTVAGVSFVNGLALSGGALDLSAGSDFDRRVGYFSDIFAGAVNNGAKVIDLDANTLAAIGNKSPEKWEGMAVGPQLANGQYPVLADTDNATA